MVARAVKLDRPAADQEVGLLRVGIAIADRFAQAGERVPKIGVRRAIRQIGPQQASQRLAGMWPVGFYRQVGQERACLVRLETNDGLPVHRSQEGTEQGQR